MDIDIQRFIDSDGSSQKVVLEEQPQLLRLSERVSQRPIQHKCYECITEASDSRSCVYPLTAFPHCLSQIPDEQFLAFMNTVSLEKEPKHYGQASQSAEWVKAMNMELEALEENHTWDLISFFTSW